MVHRHHVRQPLWARRRTLLIVVGFLVELAAVVPVVSVVYAETRREETAGDVVGKYAWRLGWHDTLHSRWLALLVLCAVVYCAGATLMAWVLSKGSPWALALAPVVAVGSMAALGVLALVLMLLIAAAGFLDGADVSFDGCLWPSGSARRRKRDPLAAEQETTT